ncbi:MAG: hypothetical protein V4750_06260 [Pseudomonadota bacterium]
MGRLIVVVQEFVVAKVLFKYRLPPGTPGAPPPVPEPVRQDANAQDGAVDRWWYESSYDLRSGLEVCDDASDTVPGDLLDELFKR